MNQDHSIFQHQIHWSQLSKIVFCKQAQNLKQIQLKAQENNIWLVAAMDRFISHEQRKLNISTLCSLEPTVENRCLLSSTCNTRSMKGSITRKLSLEKKSRSKSIFFCLQWSSRTKLNKALCSKEITGAKEKSSSFLKVDQLNYLQMANQIRKQ